MNHIIDVFTSRIALFRDSGLRAICKRLWIVWISNHGRLQHVEYVLTTPAQHLYLPDCTERPYFYAYRAPFKWGPVRLHRYDDSLTIYVAGMNVDGCPDSRTCNYEVIEFISTIGCIYTFTKYDHARQIRVDIECGSGPISTQRCAAAFIDACTYHEVRITIASKSWRFAIGIGNRWHGRYLPLQSRKVHFYHREPVEVVDPVPFYNLVKYMASPRLDIWRHLPPLDGYEANIHYNSPWS
jgi:hypothetical protein